MGRVVDYSRRRCVIAVGYLLWFLTLLECLHVTHSTAYYLYPIIGPQAGININA
jgi:hypothetical protein